MSDFGTPSSVVTEVPAAHFEQPGEKTNGASCLALDPVPEVRELARGAVLLEYLASRPVSEAPEDPVVDVDEPLPPLERIQRRRAFLRARLSQMLEAEHAE